MKIKFNDSEIDIPENQSLAQFVNDNIDGTAGVAVAVNGALVKKADWNSVVLNEGDTVLLIKAAYGG